MPISDIQILVKLHYIQLSSEVIAFDSYRLSFEGSSNDFLFSGNERLVSLLIEYDADVEFSTSSGKLPLQKAREIGKFVNSK